MKIKILLLICLCLLTEFSKAQLATERLEVMLDRPYYFTGQSIRLHYLLLTNDPLEKELVYVQVLNENDNILLQAKSLAINGVGEVEIKIPELLPNGEYSVLVYTNYLKNYGPQGTYNQAIQIYSSLENLKSPNRQVIEAFTLYPEGGTLLNDIACRVAFMMNHECEQKNFSIFNSDNKEILTVTADRQVGSFYLLPKRGETYRLVHECFSEKKVEYPLPVTKQEGVSMSIVDKTNKIQLLIRANYSLNDSIYVQGYFKNLQIFENRSILTSKGLILEIDKTDLPNDEVQFYVLMDGRVLVKSLIDFRKVSIPEIVVNEEIYNIRDRAEVSVQFSKKANRTTMVKVIPEEWVQHDFVQYKSVPKNNPYDWSILKSQNINYNNTKINGGPFGKESQNMLRGQLLVEDGVPASTKLYTLIPDLSLIYETSVDPEGFFVLPSILQSYRAENISYFAYSEEKEMQDAQINQISTSYVKNQFPPFDEPNKSILQKEYEELRIQRRLLQQPRIESSLAENEKLTIDNFVSDYDVEYRLDDYNTFNTMQEVTREILDGALLRKSKDGYKMRLFNETKRSMFNAPPFIFIDNIPTKDISKYLDIKPYQVESIRIIKNDETIRKIGPLAQSGLIIIKMKNEYSVQNGFSQLSQFPIGLNKPVTLNTSIVPGALDMRSILFWESIASNNVDNLSFSFDTSNRPGEYRVIVKSVDENGQVDFSSKKISVQFKDNKPN